jgi:hypothetical protein
MDVDKSELEAEEGAIKTAAAIAQADVQLCKAEGN